MTSRRNLTEEEQLLMEQAFLRSSKGADTMTDLRERVARAICCPGGCVSKAHCAALQWPFLGGANPTIRLVLEEAAKVAKSMGGGLDGSEVAAAILALGEK